MIAETWTDDKGAYAFERIAAGTYLVAGQDRQTNYHPDIVRVDSGPMTLAVTLTAKTARLHALPPCRRLELSI